MTVPAGSDLPVDPGIGGNTGPEVEIITSISRRAGRCGNSGPDAGIGRPAGLGGNTGDGAGIDCDAGLVGDTGTGIDRADR